MKSLLNDGSRQYLETIDWTATWSVTQHLRLMMFAQFAKQNHAKKVLDVGFGENFLAQYMERLGFEGEYHGIDLNQEYVDAANSTDTSIKAKFEHKGLDEVDETYDLIILGELVEHLEQDDVKDFLKKCKEKLNEGGTILISTPNKINGKINWPDDHADEFELKELRKIVKKSGLEEVMTFGLWNNTSNTREIISGEEAVVYAIYQNFVPQSILNVLFNLNKPEESRAILMVCQ